MLKHTLNGKLFKSSDEMQISVIIIDYIKRQFEFYNENGHSYSIFRFG